MSEHVAESKNRGVDRAVSWLLYSVHFLSTLVFALFSISAIFMSDSCSRPEVDLALCDGNYLAVVLYGYWGLLAALAVAVPMAIVVAIHRDQRSWPWALAGFATIIVLTVVFYFLIEH